MSEVKKAIMSFIKSHHDINGKPPSLKTIRERVEGASTRRFYSLFPGGMAEACRLSGIPVPKDRIKATKKARKTRESKTQKQADTKEVSSFRIILTKEQVSRLRGIAHLEGGKNIEIIIDEMLDRDTRYREEKGLSLNDTKEVFDYLKAAKEIGWEISWLLRMHTKLWNAGLKSMSSEDVEGLAVFLENMKAWGWEAGDITRILNNPFIKDALPRLSYDDGVKMVEFIREAMTEGLTVSQYLNEMAKVSQNMKLYQEYFNKQITYDQLERTVQAQ